ncbi:MAG: J domain-containing protein [Clostridiales bacterium]|nr:J domain-containing protein [Clostridiales bacterium]
MNDTALRRRLRRMKRDESRLRFDDPARPAGESVWRRYFGDPSPRYGRDLLLSMDEGAFYLVERDFYAEVLTLYMRERGFLASAPGDPSALNALGLPPDADAEETRKRFRQLAHRFHPDHGGDADTFREILDAYRKLSDRDATGRRP